MTSSGFAMGPNAETKFVGEVHRFVDSAGSAAHATVNCFDQVRIWISSDGLPAKHQARLALLRAMNSSDLRITLIVALSHLTASAHRDLIEFSRNLDIAVRDIGSIDPVDEDERIILEHIHAEIHAYSSGFTSTKGNLSVVSDYARLLSSVISSGLCTDMDVEFGNSFGSTARQTSCPYGVIARFKRNGCVSNDVTAGIPQSEPFRNARRNVAAFVRIYREAASDFLRAVYGDIVDPAVVSAHPRFFELRNRRHDQSLCGTVRFSLTGGPDNFAIALHQSGLSCGYEAGIKRGVEPGEFLPDHVPHVLVRGGGDATCLSYERFEFAASVPEAVRGAQRANLWPNSLPQATSHWDHSWIDDHTAWKTLSYRERTLLGLIEGGELSPERAMPLLAHRTVPRCLLGAGSPRSKSAFDFLTHPRGARLGRPTNERAKKRFSSRLEQTYQRRPQAEISSAASDLVDNGVVAVHGLLDEHTLDALCVSFEQQVLSKGATTALQQFSFNLAVDDCDPRLIETICTVANTPELASILDEYFGGLSRFVSARGYRQGPCKPLRYRAWDYHQDMKTAGPFEELKIMVLLTDVPHDGQAMRYACGSHTYSWKFRTQQETKFTLDEALALGGRGLFLAYGQAGTCVLFDTNGIHSGHRNL